MLLVACLLASSAAAGPIGKVVYFTSWDDSYFYAAVRVQDLDVTGTEKKPNSAPWKDDDVEVFIERDYKRATTRTPMTFQMAVSPAGGSAFTVGDGAGPKQKPIYTYKYAVNVRGTLNRSDDLDEGYDVEMAIPWAEMGGPPVPGTPMGFNVICRAQGGGFLSLSPDVKTEDDIHNPSKWAEIKFIGPALLAMTTSPARTISTKIAGRAPFIDGTLRQREWNVNTSFPMGTELKPTAPSPSAPPSQTQRLVLTHYFYWYQGDPRKPAPFEHVRYPDGSSAITDHPIRGPGPWFTYDRTSWHQQELLDIRRAGIDVILPVYWGAAEQRRGFASKGLDCLVQALYNLKAAGKEYPQVGMFFDTSAMWVAYGAVTPDLREEEVKRSFYGMIRDFFLRIPEEFRAVAPIDAAKRKQPAYIVVLYSSLYFSDLDSSFVDYCNKRFAEDFNGASIIWVGASDFKPKSPVMDAYCSYGAGLGFKYDPDGWLKMAAVGAGYDDSAVHDRTTPIRARNGGDVYKRDWGTLLSKNLDWAIVDGWNELHEGSDICASRQYGYYYVDQTAIQTLKFRAFRDYLPAFVSHNTPEVMLPGALYQIDVAVRNSGMKPWRAGDNFNLAYRWYRNGDLVSNGASRLPLQRNLKPGETLRVTIGLLTMNEQNQPLPDGDYELRWDVLQGQDFWLCSAAGVRSPTAVRIGRPEGLVGRILSVQGPCMVKTGEAYKYTVRIRNEGPEAWSAASNLSVGCRLYRMSSYVHGQPDDEMTELSLKSFSAPISNPVAPGQVLTVQVPVVFADADGKPLPAWTQKDLWYYVSAWGVRRGQDWTPQSPLGCYTRVLDILDSDYGVQFEVSNAPAAMEAGKPYEIRALVRNLGVETWTPDRFALGCHWYYADGAEAIWDGNKSPLKAIIRPGEQAVVTLKVTPPDTDGQYYLALDLLDGNRWVSTSANSRTDDILVAPVTVTKGRLAFADLSALFDTVAATFDSERSKGDFDGQGRTLPAEFLPPEASIGHVDASLCPSGYQWKTAAEKGPRVSFKLPEKSVGKPHAVSCKGQTVNLPPGKYVRLHFLAAASGQVGPADISVKYGTDSVKSSLAIESWEKEPPNVGLALLHRHNPDADERGVRCYLGHYTVEADASKTLTAIQLPSAPAIKIFAVTLEKSP